MPILVKTVFKKSDLTRAPRFPAEHAHDSFHLAQAKVRASYLFSAVAAAVRARFEIQSEPPLAPERHRSRVRIQV